jgi:hypothetical protein
LLDRGLGRTVSLELQRLGWLVHRIADEFPDDAQDIADEDWIEYGLRRGWVPLSKDGRIKGRGHERSPLVTYSGTLFYLDNQQLKIAAMVERFHLNRQRIERAARRGGPAIYAVSADSIRKAWP